MPCPGALIETVKTPGRLGMEKLTGIAVFFPASTLAFPRVSTCFGTAEEDSVTIHSWLIALVRVLDMTNEKWTVASGATWVGSDAGLFSAKATYC